MRARPSVPPASGKRTHGFLHCRVCTKSWAHLGLPDPASWPTHRCGRNVRVFDEFTLEDPNRRPLPKWDEEKAS